MSNAEVVDASVAIKWVLAEDLSQNAYALFRDFTSLRRRFIAPPHFYSEITNALYQRTRRRDITEKEADDALKELLTLNIQVIDSATLYSQAQKLARAFGLASIYDTLYIALAEMFEADLWTDDRALLNAINKRIPWVRWIGDYPLKQAA